MTLGAGVVALTLLPWRVCAVWTALGVCVEIWSWFATRAQYLGQSLTRRQHLVYLANLLSLIANWCGLALLFWHTRSVEGGFCALVIWLSILGFAQTFGSRSPLGFTVCGVIPAASMIAAVLLEPISDGVRWGPLLGFIVLALGFATAGARQTFATGRRFDETQGRLRDSEAEYRTLAHNIADVVTRTAPTGECRYISPSVQAVLGYTPEEFRALTPLSFVHPEDLAQVGEQIGALLADGVGRTVTYRAVRKDGAVTWTETSFTVVCDAETGAPLELVSTSREINARKAMEQDLVQARERAEAAAAAKADFLANMTHELRTPLNAIVGFSGVLKTSEALNARDQRHARLISDASGTLLVVVNSVLDFSKLESGAFELDPRPFDPLEMAQSVAVLLEDQARSRGLGLTVRSSGGAGLLQGDGPRLQQVVLNLLSNAVKFTPAGDIEVLVERTAAGPQAERLRLAVSDTGIGIACDKLDAVFERFSQADGSVSRRFGGTGLGLAICKQIVELMGGEIGVESREGEGSTFWFEVVLPRAVEADVAGEGEAAATELERPLRLLLVEDVDVNRELVRTILADFEIEIDEAVNGVEAVEAVRRADYDIVLMDVQMPVMDGLKATGLIRELEGPAGRRTPIIAMTANVLPEQIQRCLDAGMNAHLGKPIEPARMLETLAAFATGDPPGEAAAIHAPPLPREARGRR